MSIEILCNSTGRETRVALMESGRLAELHIDHHVIARHRHLDVILVVAVTQSPFKQ